MLLVFQSVLNQKYNKNISIIMLKKTDLFLRNFYFLTVVRLIMSQTHYKQHYRIYCSNKHFEGSLFDVVLIRSSIHFFSFFIKIITFWFIISRRYVINTYIPGNCVIFVLFLCFMCIYYYYRCLFLF